MQNKKDLGMGWFNFLYCWFIFRIIADSLGLLSTFGQIKGYRLTFGSLDGIDRLVFLIIFCAIWSIIVKLIAVLTKHKKSGYRAINCVLICDLIYYFVWGFQFELYGAIIAPLLASTFIVPTFFYLRRRKFAYDDIPTTLKCELCNNETDNLIYTEIVDDFGIKFKGLCSNCAKKYRTEKAEISNEDSIETVNETEIDKAEFCRKCDDELLTNIESRAICETDVNEQKATPIKNAKKSKSVLDIINIFVLILPCALSIVGLFECYYAEWRYITTFCCAIIAIILKILNVTKFKSNTIITLLMICTLLIMLMHCCAIAFWKGVEVVATFILTSTVYSLVCELCDLIKICIDKYHSSQSYKIKCYKKLNILNEYREKDVISQEEFEEIRKHIVSPIKLCDAKKATIAIISLILSLTVGAIAYLISESNDTYLNDRKHSTEHIENEKPVTIKNVAVRTISLSDKFTAEYVLAKWKNGEATEQAMIEIMNEHGAKQGGGKLYIIERGEFVEEIDEWCFSSNRKVGDYEIIENVYGYTICYISGFNK